MFTEYDKPGQDDLWPFSNTGSAIAAGDGVILASGATGYFSVAKGDIAATTGTGTVQTRGLVNAPKATGVAFTVGQLVFWDNSAKKITSVSSGNTRAGRIAKAAASAATTCVLSLNA